MTKQQLRNAAEKWAALCTDCRAQIVEELGFINPIYRYYEFHDFQPHSQEALATRLLANH